MLERLFSEVSPDVAALLDGALAGKELTVDDAERLMTAGCQVLMPWGAPIGTARGLANPYALRTMRNYFPGVPLIIDAGIGAPSHAMEAMEMGFDAVMLNTAVAKAEDPEMMASAFGQERLLSLHSIAAQYEPDRSPSTASINSGLDLWRHAHQ